MDIEPEPQYHRRQTSEEIAEITTDLPMPLPTEEQHRAELVAEFGDAHAHDGYVIPHAVKLAPDTTLRDLAHDEARMVAGTLADFDPDPILDKDGMLRRQDEIEAKLIGGGPSSASVASPSHYNHSGMEAIDAIRHALGPMGFRDYCRGNVMKYVWRAGYKGDPAECLRKAAWYCLMAAGDDPRSI